MDNTEDNLDVVLLQDCLDGGGLIIHHYLDEDNQIDLEKLELAIISYVSHLEISDKIEKPIYVFIKELDKYFERRGITAERTDRIKEESNFIIGFCQAVADEVSSKEVLVAYE